MASCEIGWFGKLPASLEFLKWNASGSVVGKLDQWIQEAIVLMRSQAQETWKQEFLSSHMMEFVFGPDELNEKIVGVALPSLDQAGRVFPFLVFLRERKAKGAEMDYRDPILNGFWLDFVKMRLQDGQEQGWSKEVFESIMDQLVTQGSSHLEAAQNMVHLYQQWVNETSVRDFFDLLDDRQSFLSGGKANKTSEPRFDPESHNRALGSFPVSPQKPIGNFDVAFWMDLMTRNSGTRGEGSGVFWRRESSQRRASLVMMGRTPTDMQLKSLIQNSFDEEYWEENEIPWPVLDHSTGVETNKTGVETSLRMWLEACRQT